MITAEQLEALRAPFPAEAHKQYSAGGRTYTYITARHVMERLDEVVGPDWSTRYLLVDASAYAVECQLTVAGTTRCDVGYPNNPDWDEHKEPEKLKAAYSDALKRAAVQFGIGRYLYDDKKAAAARQSAPGPTLASRPANGSNRPMPGVAGTPKPVEPGQVAEIQRLEKALGQHPSVLAGWVQQQYGRPLDQLYASEARGLIAALKTKAQKVVAAGADDDDL